MSSSEGKSEWGSKEKCCPKASCDRADFKTNSKKCAECGKDCRKCVINLEIKNTIYLEKCRGIYISEHKNAHKRWKSKSEDDKLCYMMNYWQYYSNKAHLLNATMHEIPIEIERLEKLNIDLVKWMNQKDFEAFERWLYG